MFHLSNGVATNTRSSSMLLTRLILLVNSCKLSQELLVLHEAS